MDFDRTLPVDIERSVVRPTTGFPSSLSSPNASSLMNDTALTTTSGIETGVVLGFSPEKQSMKELEHQYQELKKENFELKLRLYYLQEQLKRQTGREGNVSEQEIKLSVQLQLQVEKLQEEKKEIQRLLLQAKTGIDSLTDKQTTEMGELKRAASSEIARLKSQLQGQIQQSDQASLEAEHEKQELQGRLVAVEATNDELNQALTARTRELTSLQSQQAVCLQQLDQKREQVAALDAELKDSNSQLEELVTRVARLGPLTDEINQLRMKAQKLEYADRDLHDELRQREARLKEMEADKNKQQMEQQRVINELKQLQRATMERTQHHYQDLLEKQNRKVNEMQADLERVSNDRKDRDRQLALLKDDLRSKETELQRTTSELNSKDQRLAAVEAEMVKKTGEIEKGNESVVRSRKALQDLKDSVQNKDKEIQRLQLIIQARDRTLSQSQENMRRVEARAKLAEEQKSRIAQLEVELRSWATKSQQLQQQLLGKQLEIEQVVSARDLEMRKLQSELQEREQEVRLMKDQMQHTSDMASKKAALAEQRLQALGEEISTRNAAVLELKQRLSEQQVELEQLRGSNIQQAQTIKEMEDNSRRQQKAMKDLQDKLESKSSGLTKVEGQLDELASEKDSRISELKQVIEGLRREKLEMETRFQREMAQLQEMNRRQQAELEKRAGKVAALVKAVREKDEAMENLKLQQAGNRSRYESASQRLSLQQQEKTQLEAQVQALTLQVANGQKALESLNERLRESMQVNEALQQRGRNAEHRAEQLASTRASDLQWQVDRAREEAERAQEDVERLQRRLASVEQDNETLRGRMNSSVSPEMQSRLIGENERLRAELRESRQLNESLRQGLQQLQQQTVAAASTEKSEVERLKSQLRECKRINDDLQSRIDEVTSAAKAAGIHPGTGSPIRGSRLASEMESWRSQLAEREHQVRLLQAKLESETSKVASMSLQTQELTSLQEHLAAIQKENTHLKEKVADMESQLRLSEGSQFSLESLVKSHAKEVVGLKGRLSDSHREVKQLEATVDILQKENLKLRSEDGDSFDGQCVDGMAFDSEADLARESASLLYSQLEKSAQLNANLCSQLSQLERSLSVEEPKSTEPSAVTGDENQQDENKGILSSHPRSQQPAIVITDVDEHASEIVLSQDPTLINLITAGCDQPLYQHVEQIRDLRQQLAECQQSNEELRERLRSLICGQSALAGIKDSHHRDEMNSPDSQAGLASSQEFGASRSTLDDLYRRLKATNDLKEQTARSIYDRLIRTHRVLQEAQTNLHRQANGFETRDEQADK